MRFDMMCDADKHVQADCATDADVPPRAFMSKTQHDERPPAWRTWMSTYGEDVALVLVLVFLTLVVQAWTVGSDAGAPVSGRALLARAVDSGAVDSTNVLSASVGAHDPVGDNLATTAVSFWLESVSGYFAVVRIFSLMGLRFQLPRSLCWWLVRLRAAASLVRLPMQFLSCSG